MSSHQTEAITIVNGEITVDAELLGPKLGLAALKAEMRKGIVPSVTETGINEGAGRTLQSSGHDGDQKYKAVRRE